MNWRQETFADAVPVKVLFSVSKKRFKRAVDRNLLKRKMRESYRQQKQEFLFPQVKISEKQLLVSLAYIGKEVEDYALMMKKMQKALQQLAEKLAS